MTEIPHLRQGHLSTIQFSCTRCHLNYYVSEPTKEIIDLWRSYFEPSFALASDLIGIDETALCKFCAVLGIDGPPSSFYETYQTKILDKISNLNNEKLT